MMLLNDLRQRLQALDDGNLRRFRRTTETASAPHVTVDGRPMLAFCSNDYLGLAADPRLADALREGVRLYGAGSGASHLVSGHSRAHAQLEARIADLVSGHIPQAGALYFCTGYMANLAVITGLVASDANGSAEIFSEALNHASLIDGTRLARVPTQVYPHGDIVALDHLLKNSQAAVKIVLTDSVFSMDGDLAPVPALLDLCQRYNAWLVVDDAHGFGMLGERGIGALEHFGLRSEHLVLMGTLGKAAGVGGAFVAAHADVVDWLVQRARPYIYTTAAPPALAHALLTSLDIMSSDEGKQRRDWVNALIRQLREGLSVGAGQLIDSQTAIQPLVIGSNQAALEAAARLYEAGLWVPAIRPPTVPAGSARLRITLSAAHTAGDVNCLLDALNALGREAA